MSVSFSRNRSNSCPEPLERQKVHFMKEKTKYNVREASEYFRIRFLSKIITKNKGNKNEN